MAAGSSELLLDSPGGWTRDALVTTQPSVLLAKDAADCQSRTRKVEKNLVATLRKLCVIPMTRFIVKSQTLKKPSFGTFENILGDSMVKP